MKNKKLLFIWIVMMVIALGLSGCDALEEEGLITSQDKSISASGTIEAEDISISSEIGGMVKEIYVQKGDEVQPGDLLFKLDDATLQAQKTEAQAAVDSAEANITVVEASLDVARAALNLAQTQYEMTLMTAHMAEQQTRIENWDEELPDAFDYPSWYFNKEDDNASIAIEVSDAKAALETEKENYASLISDSVYSDLDEAEKRLSDAQIAYLVAEDVLDRANDQNDADLTDYAQDNFDAAEAELEAAQSNLDQLLSDKEAEDLLEAKARVVIAQERYDTALDRLYASKTGENSYEVILAKQTVDQAAANVAAIEASIEQAQTLIEQAYAGLQLIELQIEKMAVYAPASGVIRTLNIAVGEILQPGVSALIIDQIDMLTITLYLPEDQYGQVKIGDVADISVDSWPEDTFEAEVTRIADRAEYTPRNVQTQEERVTTVYAVELSIDDYDGKLKPGMPADADFTKNPD